jgi:hypothetical protein
MFFLHSISATFICLNDASTKRKEKFTKIVTPFTNVRLLFLSHIDKYHESLRLMKIIIWNGSSRNILHRGSWYRAEIYPTESRRYDTVESLQSHCNHTQFHWSSGPPVCFTSWGTWAQSLGGYLCETRILLLALSCYIGDPDRDWSLWPLRWASSRTVTRPSCWQCDNPTWSHTALLSRFHAHCRSSFRLHNWHSRLLGGEPCGEPAFTRSSTGPVVHLFASRHEGPVFIPHGRHKLLERR